MMNHVGVVLMFVTEPPLSDTTTKKLTKKAGHGKTSEVRDEQ